LHVEKATKIIKQHIMTSIKGTQTELNLLKSFAGESQARMRYTFYAKQAKKEGYEQIAAIFQETADQEMTHAKRMFKYLEGGMVEITASYPAGVIATTAENLKAAAEGENEEWTDLYPHFAEVAEAEGFKEIATMYRMIAKAEAVHEERYLKLLARVESGTVFAREEAIDWICRHCGYVFTGKKPPKNCPTCLHPQAYFEPMNNAL
jgi:rubrerythrin